jgi:hypothetical protein
MNEDSELLGLPSTVYRHITGYMPPKLKMVALQFYCCIAD